MFDCLEGAVIPDPLSFLRPKKRQWRPEAEADSPLTTVNSMRLITRIIGFQDYQFNPVGSQATKSL